MDRPHPWRRLAQHWPEVEVHHDLEQGAPWAYTDFSTQPPSIHMYKRLNQRERRAAVCHESFHLERGPIPAGGYRREEQVVCDLTARWLLPDLDEIRQLLGCLPARDVAEELWVPWPVFSDRLNGLTEWESRWVHSRSPAC